MTDERDNVQVFGVEHLTLSLKKVVESSFLRVRVRGELRGLKVHESSGHMYGSLREGSSVLDVVCWRSRRGRLKVVPEEGMEVIATGRVTVYGGRSRYQLDVEDMELAGEGAILKMLHERRVRLEGEGLFLAERKRSLPLCPEVVGLVTSFGSAAMHDIVKAVGLRMGIHILVWPSLMQGLGSVGEVVSGLEGFNGLEEGGAIPRPDVIIVARGGGSLEDLLPFSDEAILRAVAASEIPVVSAIGHESDDCLLDDVADVRAATPTAAAVLVVPLRKVLEERVGIYGERLRSCVWEKYESLRRDEEEKGERMMREVRGLWERKRVRCEVLRVMVPRDHVRVKEGDLREKLWRLKLTGSHHGERKLFEEWVWRLSRFFPDGGKEERRFLAGVEGLKRGVTGVWEGGERSLKVWSRILENLDERSVLRRGFVIVRGVEGGVVTDSEGAKRERDLRLEFFDGEVLAGVQEGREQEEEGL
jgi:exodeoxyribonuclease VII large subunit